MFEYVSKREDSAGKQQRNLSAVVVRHGKKPPANLKPDKKINKKATWILLPGLAGLSQLDTQTDNEIKIIHLQDSILFIGLVSSRKFRKISIILTDSNKSGQINLITQKLHAN